MAINPTPVHNTLLLLELVRDMMTLHVPSDIGRLRGALVCQPDGFEFVAPINQTQQYYLQNDPPTKKGLLEDHHALVGALEDSGVELGRLRGVPGCAYQVFARDIGFVVGSTMVFSRMVKSVRQSEVNILDEFALSEGWQVWHLGEGRIEGGDVIVTDRAVFVGISQRTSISAFESLRNGPMGGRSIVPVPLREDVLHLDTVLSVLGNETVVYYPDGLQEGLPAELTHNHRIAITHEEMFSLAANLLPLSSTRVVGQQRHARVNELLRDRGIDVVPLALPHLTKLGGGARCCVLPINTSQ
jgi:N-dimethylarginine dimethylaminohydrolase